MRMKTTLLAAAALSLVACSQSESFETSEATATASIPSVTVPVRIDVSTDLSEMRCRILKGSWISFRFQFHDFMAYGADDIVTCGEKLDALKATPVQTGTIASERQGDTMVLTLKVGGFAFTSRTPSQFDGLVVSQTSDVAPAFTNAWCELRKGFSVLHADFDGATFEQSLDFDACDAAKVELAGSHTGARKVDTYERHTWQELRLDGGKWLFTSDSRD